MYKYGQRGRAVWDLGVIITGVATKAFQTVAYYQGLKRYTPRKENTFAYEMDYRPTGEESEMLNAAGATSLHQRYASRSAR